jgi:two-component sensor histidine kinase
MPMTLDSPGTADQGRDVRAASAFVGGNSLVAASRLVADPIVQPIYGRIASDERRAGFLAVAAIAERLSRTAGSTCLAFDDYLRDLCVDLAAMPSTPGGPTLACTASAVQIPVGAAITLGLIAEELVNNALVHGFPDGRGGRIAVELTMDTEAWWLTVEDSGIARRAEPSRRGNGLMIARLLLLQLDGTLETESGVIGGTRCVVSIPRPQHRA